MLRLRREGILTGRKFLKLSCLIHMMVLQLSDDPRNFSFCLHKWPGVGNNFGEIRIPHKGDIVGQVMREHMKCSMSLIRSLIIWRR